MTCAALGVAIAALVMSVDVAAVRCAPLVVDLGQKVKKPQSTTGTPN